MEEDREYFFYWNIGFVNNELHLSQDDNPYIFSAQLLNYYAEYDNNLITFEISPFKYWFFGENKVQKITFLNFSMMFLNLLGDRYFGPDYRFFGSIVSINWLENEFPTNFNIENYTLSFGLRFSMKIFSGYQEGGTFKRPDYMGFVYDLEIGYRIINGRHSFYIGARIDPSGIYSFLAVVGGV